MHILELVSSLDSDEVERGMREGLASRLIEDRDYTVTTRNAHGDMPTLSAIVDAAVGDDADLIMTLSTPTLQTAVQRVKTLPIIFSFSSNPIGAGAGKSYEEHLPNVTGVPTVGAYEECDADHPRAAATGAPARQPGRAVRGELRGQHQASRRDRGQARARVYHAAGQHELGRRRRDAGPVGAGHRRDLPGGQQSHRRRLRQHRAARPASAGPGLRLP